MNFKWMVRKVATPKFRSYDQEQPSHLESQITGSTIANPHHSKTSLKSLDLEAGSPLEHPCKFCHAFGFVRNEGGKIKDMSCLLDIISEQRHLKLFHEKCDKCSNSGSQASLCSFCAHLRPWHFFSHALPESGLGLQDWYHPFISLGDLVEIRTRAPDCEFCDFLARSFPLSNVFPWTNIVIVVGHKSKLLLFAGTEHVGDLLLDPQRISAVRSCPGIQWDLIRGWLGGRTYQPSHGEPSPGQMFDYFRLIDVTKNCVVRVSEHTKYATLSYVWGRVPEANFEATDRNIKALELEGSLAAANVPVTIRDAIVATKELGLKYLWVDRICIVQDDDQSKLPQIYRMDIIFASSYVTLVAEGQDAMCGLPGVQSDRTGIMQTVNWNELNIGFPYWSHSGNPDTTSHHHWDPGMSDWYRRGWTYQEAVVSKRLLYFTNDGVFLEAEDRDTVLVEGGTHAPRPRWSTYSHPGYYEAVREITARNFTYSSDILLAFQGILNWIIGTECRTEKGHRFGMPFEEFDLAVLWEGDTSAPKRSPDKQHTFPSWSWASFEGRIDFISAPFHIGSLATWAFCEKSANNQLHLLPVASRPKAFYESWKEDGSVRMMEAWLEGCFATVPPSNFTQELADCAILPMMDLHFPTYDDFWQASRGEQWQQDMFSSDDLRIASLHPGRLMVHTQCALLDLEYVDPMETSDSTSLFRIKSPNGEGVGAIKLHPVPQKTLSSLYMQTGRMRMEFLALTVLLDEPNWVWNCFQDKDRLYDPHTAVTVMLVHRCGLVAHRLGIGYVYLQIWSEMEREVKTVILE